ncbi:nucleotidyltransferase family protein [Azohydromonas caseinilytica]|uniref:Nucleotidyltransferase family protein n=1 Tax=Azohydromonas caseinilytica TaxID=2728836 RepID=A0A848FDJ9_9BURK|nr:nucleotidyltransferase family protein [Azohydromonas caseinilytica]NML16230.1 nucleotidyltransferase family protein [Azohydromonas caseinilytica]
MTVTALILAAGRGERMRPLSDRTPKPLLSVQGRRLIEWHLQALARAGVRRVVINTAWLEEQFEPALGDGSRYGLEILYSHEGRDHGGALETAGGMKKALPLLSDTFWVVSGDVFVPEFAFAHKDLLDFQATGTLARLWLTDNPPHHPRGDFGIRDGLAVREAEERFTWTSLGLFRRAFVEELMADLPHGAKAPLRPYLDAAIGRGALGAQRWCGGWTDVGTPERLAALDAQGRQTA